VFFYSGFDFDLLYLLELRADTIDTCCEPRVTNIVVFKLQVLIRLCSTGTLLCIVLMSIGDI